MSTPTPWGTEFLVNTTTIGSQDYSSITGLIDGRFVVTWGNDDFAPVRMQLFNADGSKFGTELQLDGTQIYQEPPSIAALSDGRFVLVWTDVDGDTSSSGIRAQIFNANGSVSGDSFPVNTTTTDAQYETAVTALGGGRFVAAWLDQSQTGGDTSGFAVRAQVFNADGSKSGAEFLINTTTTNRQYMPSLTTLADGRFVAAWLDDSGSIDHPGRAVRAQIFNDDGSKVGLEFIVSSTPTHTEEFPSLTALTNGGFVASWSDYTTDAADGSEIGVMAQVFDANGSKSGSAFLVNTTAQDLQYDSKLTALADGRFVATWWDEPLGSSNPNRAAIYAQVFNSDGSKSGSEFLVNTIDTGSQTSPAIASLADGRFVVSWADFSHSADDPDGGAIRAQIFDPRESAINLSGSTLGDDFVGTQWADTMSGGLGEDQIRGADGNDWINGGAQNDTLWGDAGNDTLQGSAGSDTLIGGTGNDTYFVDTASDTIVENAFEGQDTVISAWLSLSLANYANVEHAQVTGLQDLDLTGNNGANRLTGNGGANLIMGLGGNDRIFAQAGNDTVFGGNGNDLLDGAAGNDTLNGGTGMDTLFGGVGKDRLIGGADADTFAFRTKAEAGNGVNRDVIVDFAVGEDKIDLSAIDANEGVTGDQAFSFIGSAAFSHTAGELRYGSAGGFLYADTNGDGIADFQLQLIGKPAIAGEDFML